MFWQTEAPKHWQVRKLKHTLRKLVREKHDGAELLVCTNKGTVVKRGDSRLGLVAEDESIYQGVSAGDLLIHGMDTWHGAMAVSHYDGMCTTVVHVCDCLADNSKSFVAYYLRNLANSRLFKLISNGVRQNTSDFRCWDKLAALSIVLPSPAEQQRIVAYLDEKTSKIDRLIQLKEREIELLNEKKQAMIVDVLRRTVAGVNTIPFGQTMRLKSVCGFADLPLLSVYLNLGVVRFDDIDEKRTNVTSLDVSKYQRVDPGDFVLNNQQAWRGSVGVSLLTGIISPAYVIATLYPMWDTAYANCYLRSRLMVDRYVICSKGIGSIQRNLDWDALKQERVPMPPLKLQKEAVAKIAVVTAKIDAAVAAIEKGIGLLKERRTRLVSDAVTGRIDLRSVSGASD